MAGGTVDLFTGVNFGGGVVTGSVVAGGVAGAAGVLAGRGVTRRRISGGVALAETAGTEGDGAAEGTIDGEGLNIGGDGRILTEGDADAIGDGVAATATVALGAVEAAAEGDGRVLAEADGETAADAVAVA